MIDAQRTERPDTFAFKTGDGAVGLLQTEAGEKDADKLTIRYRLERPDRATASERRYGHREPLFGQLLTFQRRIHQDDDRHRVLAGVASCRYRFNPCSLHGLTLSQRTSNRPGFSHREADAKSLAYSDHEWIDCF
jgi:hypothetical protein